MKFSRPTTKHLTIFVVSDSLGETARRAALAAVAQFNYDHSIEIKRFPFIDTRDELVKILMDCKKEEGILLTTLANKDLVQFCVDYSREHDIEFFDYLSPLVHAIERRTSLTPNYETGMLQTLDKDYFSRIEAIEFAVKYDDGKDPNGFLKADLVLLGVSRTSKTPLSIFLAHKGYKVTNLPVVPEARIPDQLFDVPREKIVGLMASPEYIRQIRSERVIMMGLSRSSTYNSLERIKQELLFFNDLMAKLRAPLVNIEGKSVEETSQYVEEFILKPQKMV